MVDLPLEWGTYQDLNAGRCGTVAMGFEEGSSKSLDFLSWLGKNKAPMVADAVLAGLELSPDLWGSVGGMNLPHAPLRASSMGERSRPDTLFSGWGWG